MKTVWLTMCCLMGSFVGAQASAADGVDAEKGQMVMSASGGRLAQVYRVDPDGSPVIILEGKMIKVPFASLSNTNGQLTTSLSKKEVLALH